MPQGVEVQLLSSAPDSLQSTVRQSTVRQKKKKKRRVIAVGVAVLAVSGVWWISSGKNRKPIPVPAYRAEKIIDGDTFMTADKQMVRLAYIDAPDLINCGGVESKNALSSLIMNKNLYIKTVVKDEYGRIVVLVYNDQGLVSEQMLALGWAYYARGGSGTSSLATAVEEAKKKKLGIYGEECTPTENKENPRCVIKGNQLYGSDKKYYRFPGCGQYNNTLVQRYLGDRWFCTEKEAVAAGYEKGSDCFGKKWK